MTKFWPLLRISGLHARGFLKLSCEEEDDNWDEMQKLFTGLSADKFELEGWAWGGGHFEPQGRSLNTLWHMGGGAEHTGVVSDHAAVPCDQNMGGSRPPMSLFTEEANMKFRPAFCCPKQIGVSACALHSQSEYWGLMISPVKEKPPFPEGHV